MSFKWRIWNFKLRPARTNWNGRSIGIMSLVREDTICKQIFKHSKNWFLFTERQRRDLEDRLRESDLRMRLRMREDIQMIRDDVTAGGRCVNLLLIRNQSNSILGSDSEEEIWWKMDHFFPRMIALTVLFTENWPNFILIVWKIKVLNALIYWLVLKTLLIILIKMGYF